MNKWWWQLKRELGAFFYAPLAYVLLGASAVLNGAMFLLILSFLSGPAASPGAPMELLFSWVFFWVTVLLFTPLVTMRLVAEERQSGTLETLSAAPLSSFQVVLAKYISAFVAYLVIWLPTLLYPLLLRRLAPIDPGPIYAGYLGTFLLGTMFCAVGLLCSALAPNQVVAALLSLGALMGLFLVGMFGHVDAFVEAPFIEYVDLMGQMEAFSRGIVDTRFVVYDLSVAGLALFLTVQVMRHQRWAR